MMNVLALTDFSNDAYNALFFASQLFKSEKCTFHILNTYNEYTPLLSSSRTKGKKLMQLLADESAEGLKHDCHRIILDTGKNPLHTYKTISNNCDLLDCLGRIVNKEKIDFVVMGNKGKTGAKDIFLGGNTVHIIKTIKDCPLLCVPKEIDFIAPKRIAFTTSFEDNYSSFVLKNMTKILSFINASMHVLYLDKGKALQKNQIKNKDVLLRSIKNFEIHEHQIPFKKTKAKAINEFIEKEGMDMLLMVHHDHHFLEKILREPVISDISFYLDIPFIVIPDQD